MAKSHSHVGHGGHSREVASPPRSREAHGGKHRRIGDKLQQFSRPMKMSNGAMWLHEVSPPMAGPGASTGFASTLMTRNIGTRVRPQVASGTPGMKAKHGTFSVWTCWHPWG